MATTSAAPSDAGVLAGEVAKAFAERAAAYKRYYQFSDEEARTEANQHDPETLQRARHGRPEESTWGDLDILAAHDEKLAVARWEEIKREALNELQTGHRTGQCVEPPGAGPWQRAQYLALRTELFTAWQPRDGLERQLLEAMAQVQATCLSWLEALTLRASSPSFTDGIFKREGPRWEPPRQRDADAMDQAAAMVDRFNRIFLRTLRALRELRRQSRPVILQSGGQLNVANQQVNVACE
jgi:hypothetical protein